MQSVVDELLQLALRHRREQARLQQIEGLDECLWRCQAARADGVQLALAAACNALGVPVPAVSPHGH